MRASGHVVEPRWVTVEVLYKHDRVADGVNCGHAAARRMRGASPTHLSASGGRIISVPMQPYHPLAPARYHEFG